MRIPIKAVAVAIVFSSAAASAQIEAGVSVSVVAPVITFDVAPPLVEVSPGVMIVPEYGEEVFFTSGWYWCRRDGVWFRTHDYRGGWIMAPPAYVPGRLFHVPPGRYVSYHARAGQPVRYYNGRQLSVARPPGHGYARGHEYAPRGGHEYAPRGHEYAPRGHEYAPRGGHEYAPRSGGPAYHAAAPAYHGGGGRVMVAHPAGGGGGGGRGRR
jgi:hypothetical protein